ncbi:MAG: hypothetical protein ACRC0V_11210, partial [Fusobacteriaceae bacterium]|uniref:hypothetical protein n=1 Tax=Romboutsia sp. TaxID=1965302 RepID=UPI003F2CB4E6
MKKTKQKNKRPKCAFGSSIDPLENRNKTRRNIMEIENPNDALVRNDLMFAQAQLASEDNLTRGLDIGGGLAMSVGQGMMGGAFGKMGGEGTGKLADFVKKNKETIQLGSNIAATAPNMFAYGGKVPVEVEGNEAAETPNGQLLDFKGPSHNNGGIDVDLPQGTNVFSDRIKIKGKSMADRKKNRERKTNALSKILNNNKQDLFVKNALGRVEETNAIEEQQDLDIQTFINQTKEAINGKPKLGWGEENLG